MTTDQPYDSGPDTTQHIHRVQELVAFFCEDLETQVLGHDQSKLQEPEKSAFDRLTPRLKELTYGTPEYDASKAELGEALAHHYANNSHHPEHRPEGVAGMTLLDLVEMSMDWKAASERHPDGDIFQSIETNVTRFGIEPQLAQILRNTAQQLWGEGVGE